MFVLNSVKKYLVEIIEEGKCVTFPNKFDVYFTCLCIALIVFIVVFGVSLIDFVISYIIKIMFGIG